MTKVYTFSEKLDACEKLFGVTSDNRAEFMATFYATADECGLVLTEVLNEILLNSGEYKDMKLGNLVKFMSKKFKKRNKGNVLTVAATNKKTFPRYAPPVVVEPKWKATATSLTPVKSFISDQDLGAPIVAYTPKVKAIIDYLVKKSPQEVGWLGTVRTLDGGYLIDRIYVPKQQVSGTETDIDQDAMAALTEELFAAGLDPGTLFYWGHSHVNMGVSPSGQDERQVRDYLESCPIFIREIRNKKGDVKVDVYDRENRVVHQCVTTRVIYELTPDEQTHMDALLAANVQTSRVITYGANNTFDYAGVRY